MGTITDLRLGKGREKRISVFLDGRFAFSLPAEAVGKEGLQVGQELPPGRVEVLVRSERLRRCFDAAARFLSYRPRSEAEVRERLSRRGFENESIEAVITRLKQQRLVDDAAFVQFWKENRESFSPRSQRLTRLELMRKGVATEVIDQAVNAIDDSDSAYRAALGKARRLLPSEYQAFRRRLGEYLRRRGFSYEVINRTVGLVWQEMRASQAGDSIELISKDSSQ